MTATATSNTQSVVTFAIPTSGFVTVGGPMAGPAATILTTTTGSAAYYGARAWVNFNGTGTVAIRASSNVSSITDNNTGDYSVNLTTSMADANYAVSVSVGGTNTVDIIRLRDETTARTASLFRILSLTNGFVAADAAYINAIVIR
jgi:hypothetical protein